MPPVWPCLSMPTALGMPIALGISTALRMRLPQICPQCAHYPRSVPGACPPAMSALAHCKGMHFAYVMLLCPEDAVSVHLRLCSVRHHIASYDNEVSNMQRSVVKGRCLLQVESLVLRRCGICYWISLQCCSCVHSCQRHQKVGCFLWPVLATLLIICDSEYRACKHAKAYMH